MLLRVALYGLSALCSVSTIGWLFTLPPVSTSFGVVALSSGTALVFLLLIGVLASRVE